MKKIAFFSIPAHGHTNPMLPVAAELVGRGNTVRFYSFNEFEEKIRAAGAEFVSCDSFLPPLTKQEESGLKNVSAAEMTVQDIRITLRMDEFLDQEFHSFRPDVVFTDSVCFWGKLNAWKHHVPKALPAIMPLSGRRYFPTPCLKKRKAGRSFTSPWERSSTTGRISTANALTP